MLHRGSPLPQTKGHEEVFNKRRTLPKLRERSQGGAPSRDTNTHTPPLATNPQRKEDRGGPRDGWRSRLQRQPDPALVWGSS